LFQDIPDMEMGREPYHPHYLHYHQLPQEGEGEAVAQKEEGVGPFQ
jgi:hypothetical protein